MMMVQILRMMRQMLRSLKGAKEILCHQTEKEEPSLLDKVLITREARALIAQFNVKQTYLLRLVKTCPKSKAFK